MAWEGIAYSIGYYKGRGSTYDKRRALVKKKPTLGKKVGKAVLWAICWGFFLLCI
jgi:hypothetical protein